MSPLPLILLFSFVFAGFLKVKDTQIVDSATGKEVILKGIAFGNNCFTTENTKPQTDHTFESYKDMKELGFNSGRFYLNTAVFEDDSNPYVYKENGWNWLDQEIEAARNNSYYLILNMHYPQGGIMQYDGTLLLDEENTWRFNALWKEIAKRYKNEEYIAGYGLVNEPTGVWKGNVSSSLEFYNNFFMNTTKQIREVDPNHIIFMEPPFYYVDSNFKHYSGTKNVYGDMTKIDDDNVVYERHMYSPIQYTHQNVSFMPQTINYFYSYPNETLSLFESYVKWVACSKTTMNANTITRNEWITIENTPYIVNSSTGENAATMVVLASKLGTNGYALFKDYVLKEYDENGNIIQQIDGIITEDSFKYKYSSDGTGNHEFIEDCEGGGCWKISGVINDYGLTLGQTIIARPNHKFVVTCKVKLVSDSTSSFAHGRTELSKYQIADFFNKDYLIHQIQTYDTFGKQFNVPIYVGEFGTNYYSFQDGRNGVQWVNDVLDILKDLKYSFSYHSYHGEGFGLYLSNPYGEVTNLNVPLNNLFKQKLQQFDSNSDSISESEISSNSYSDSNLDSISISNSESCSDSRSEISSYSYSNSYSDSNFDSDSCSEISSESNSENNSFLLTIVLTIILLSII